MAKLKTDYVDLLLLHSPVKEKYVDSWNIIEEFHRDGQCRKIGVSNFKDHELDHLLKNTDIKPYVNQIELSPFLVRKDLVGHCWDLGIKVVAHSSLAKGEKFGHPILSDLSTKYNLSEAQIMLQSVPLTQEY